jgi:hypothetical protein
MASDFDLREAMARITQMEIDALVDIEGAAVDAKAYFPYEQEAFPYWTNRVVNMLTTYPFGQDIALYSFQVGARLVMGHFTQGYEGEILTKAYDYIPAVLEYFKDRPYLTNSVQTTPLSNIWVDTGEGAEITNVVGPSGFVNSGIGAIQVGVEFTILLPFIAQLY